MQFDIVRRNGDVHTVLVDDEDAVKVQAHRWCVMDHGLQMYVFTNIQRDGKRTCLYLHHLIMGQKGIDHINHNGLDNRRANLRVATQGQNLRNARAKRNGSSPLKGVSRRSDGRWRARIFISGREVYLGSFTSEKEAAAAYDRAALAEWGEFAFTNEMAVA
jgi:hypothetical protein